MTLENQEFRYENYSNKTEDERKTEIAKSLEFSKEKKKLSQMIEKDKQLIYLRSLVER
jgi:hypothetical protein